MDNCHYPARRLGKDEESIEACNEHDIAMVFTGVRHFETLMKFRGRIWIRKNYGRRKNLKRICLRWFVAGGFGRTLPLENRHLRALESVRLKRRLPSFDCLGQTAYEGTLKEALEHPDGVLMLM